MTENRSKPHRRQLAKAGATKIYNITLRDYDIATAGKNVKGKSVFNILVFGLGNTRSYENSVYPKQ